MQGVIKSYDPGSRDGIVMRDTDLAEIDLAPDALRGSVFRQLRQGQRVIFDLDGEGRATPAAGIGGRHGDARARSRALPGRRQRDPS